MLNFRVFLAAALLSFGVSGAVQSMGCVGCGVGGQGTAGEPKTGGQAILSKLQSTLFQNNVGVLLNPQRAPYDDKDMRFAVLNMINRQAVIETLAGDAALSSFFDFSTSYQSAFPFGWNAFEPFSDEDWRTIQALLPDLKFSNQATTYSEKRGNRIFDRRAARTANQTLQGLGYAVSPEDGVLKDSAGQALSLRVPNVVSGELTGVFDQPFLINPLKQVGFKVDRIVAQGYFAGNFDAIMTSGAGIDQRPLRELIVNLSRDVETGADLQIILSKIGESADANFPDQSFQSLDMILNANDPGAAEIQVLVRLFDKLLVSNNYFLPITYACTTQESGVPCVFPN